MVKNRKYAIICAYNGTNYHGCQINNQVKTIETTLLDILDELNLLPQQTNEENSEETKEEEINEEELSEEKENSVKEINIFKKYNINKIGLQRSSRTDKGVHSSFNTFVIKSPVDLTTKKIEIQQNLPEDIYIYKILRVTKGFVAQKRCESRVYHYYIKKDLFTYKRKERDIKKVVEALILNYLGYKNYFNFTNLRNKKDTKRYIRRISLTEENGYFLIELEGNSFLYNQIRKMMGYLVQVVRDSLSIFEKEFVSIDTNLSDKNYENSTLIDLINRSFNKCFTNQMEILKAPGEFLILYYQGYKNYNEKHSTLHGKIEVDKNELNEVTDKLIKNKMFVEENDKIFCDCVDKFDELRNKNIEINN